MYRQPTDLMEYASDVSIGSVFWGLIILGCLWLAYEFILEFFFVALKKISDFKKKFLG